MKRNSKTALILIGAAATGLAGSASAAVIVTAGSDLDVAQNQNPTGVQSNQPENRAIVDYWRTTSVAKPNDIDGDNALGTDGYHYEGAGVQTAVPSYASIDLINTNFGGNNGYAVIGNGSVPPGATVIAVGSGTFNPNPGGAEGVFTTFGTITFTATAAVGETVRISLMVDNLDNTNFNSGSLRLTDVASGTNTDVSVFTTTGAHGGTDARGNRNPDWYYFDVTNFTAGEQIEFFATSSHGNGGTNRAATIGAFAFDSIVVPEPSSVFLLGLGALGLLRRRK